MPCSPPTERRRRLRLADGSGRRRADRPSIDARSATNYRNALGATYPVVRRLVGTPFFDAAVDAYVEAHPSRSGDLNEYGDDVRRFSRRLSAGGRLALSARCRAPRMGDRRGEPRGGFIPLRRTTVLGELAGRSGGTNCRHCGLRIDPSFRLIASPFPVLRIWQVNQPDHGGDLRVDFDARPDRLRIRRERARGRDRTHRRRRFRLAGRRSQARELAVAIERAQDADAAFDLRRALHRSSATARSHGDHRHRAGPSVPHRR